MYTNSRFIYIKPTIKWPKIEVSEIPCANMDAIWRSIGINGDAVCTRSKMWRHYCMSTDIPICLAANI